MTQLRKRQHCGAMNYLTHSRVYPGEMSAPHNGKTSAWNNAKLQYIQSSREIRGGQVLIASLPCRVIDAPLAVG
jgi:hypothetical protein